MQLYVGTSRDFHADQLAAVVLGRDVVPARLGASLAVDDSAPAPGA
jgi:hypothetical protein